MLGKHNFNRIDPDVVNKKVVIVFDNDGKELNNDKIFLKASSRLIGFGKEVYIVMPSLLGGMDKTDMNDVLIRHGVEGVEKVVRYSMKKVSL